MFLKMRNATSSWSRCPASHPNASKCLLDSSSIIVRASCTLPFGPSARAIRRLEIPYGYFERRIQLAAVPFEVVQREVANGCLLLNLRKVI